MVQLIFSADLVDVVVNVTGLNFVSFIDFMIHAQKQTVLIKAAGLSPLGIVEINKQLVCHHV